MAAPEIPKKQKAVIYDNPGTVSTKVVEIDVPEPGPGEVLINLYVRPSINLYLHGAKDSSCYGPYSSSS